MNRTHTNALEHVARSAVGLRAQGYDGQVHFAALLGALVPAIGILAVTATLLLVVS